MGSHQTALTSEWLDSQRYSLQFLITSRGDLKRGGGGGGEEGEGEREREIVRVA